MHLAFVLATFSVSSVLEFALAHALGLSLSGIVLAVLAMVLLAIFLPGSVPLIRTAIAALMQGLRWLIGTTTGRVILLAVGCLVAGWSARAYLDDSIAVRRQLVAQAAATAQAQAAAAQARLQAAMLRDVGDRAARRAEASEAEDRDDEEAAADLQDRLEAADRAAGAGKARCKLTAADAAALERIGTPRAAKPR